MKSNPKPLGKKEKKCCRSLKGEEIKTSLDMGGKKRPIPKGESTC